MEFLRGHGIRGMSPLRGKQYLRELGELNTLNPKESLAGVLSSPKGIMSRDFYDCTTCDAVLFNLLGAQKISIGTMMELAWCYQNHTPAIAVMEPGNIHEHAMVNEAIGFRVHTLAEALQVCCAVLNPW